MHADRYTCACIKSYTERQSKIKKKLNEKKKNLTIRIEMRDVKRSNDGRNNTLKNNNFYRKK